MGEGRVKVGPGLREGKRVREGVSCKGRGEGKGSGQNMMGSTWLTLGLGGEKRLKSKEFKMI